MEIDRLSSRLREKEKYFREFSVWPDFTHFNTEDWLKNFCDEEIPIAVRLLTSFTFFNEKMTNALLCSAIQNYYCHEALNCRGKEKKLEEYISETAFVFCEGEDPHPTDSGYLFTRKLRDTINISVNNILSPKEALTKMALFKRYIFIDDFAGSGNQFVDTWKRKHQTEEGNFSFHDIYHDVNLKFAYCCCISTWKAKDRIERKAPIVTLSSAHQISKHHSATDCGSYVWHDMDKVIARDLLKKASFRAGYCSEDGGENDWRGFHALGLTMAFNHGIPDASLPIFYSNRNNWTPLIYKSPS